MSKDNSCCCQKPENLETTPEECTPETIKQCHGEELVHACVPEGKNAEDKNEKSE